MKKIVLLFSVCVLMACQSNSESDSKSDAKKEGTEVLMGGNKFHTVGKLPEKGEKAPDFNLADKNMDDKSLKDFKGKYIVMNIFPSIDTKVCSASVVEFNQKAPELENTVVLGISKDLPFAQERFCGAEDIENVITLSDFRSTFGEDYGVQLADGKSKGLLSRAVVVINPEGEIIYTEQVKELSNEPNYDKVMEVIKE